MTLKRKNKIDFSSKNYINKGMTSKRKYVKSGNYTKEEILKRKMAKIFDKAEKLHDKVGKNWYQKLANLHKSINEVKKDTTTTIPNLGQKRKYVKSGNYTKDAILKRKMVKIFDKFNKITNEAESYLKEGKSWYNNLKKSITNLFSNQRAKFELEKQALGVSKKFVIDLQKYGLNLYNPLKLFETIKPLVLEKFKEYPSTKQQITYECLMKKINLVTQEEETDHSHFHSEQQKIYEGSNFDEIYETMFNKIESFETYSNNSSQWVFEEGTKIILNINDIKLLKGSSWIPLPNFLKNKKVLINPKNYDVPYGVLQFMKFWKCIQI